MINLSAYARLIRPALSKELYSEPSIPAIVMALTRTSRELKRKRNVIGGDLSTLHNLSVRTNLSEYAFHRSTSLLELQKALSEQSEANKELFVSFTQGISK